MPDTLYEAMQCSLEPLAMTDGPTMKLAQLDLRAALSQAISMKRIADAMEKANEIAARANRIAEADMSQTKRDRI